MQREAFFRCSLQSQAMSGQQFIALAVILALGINVNGLECPSNFEQVGDFGCIEFNDDGVGYEWFAASYYCENQGAHLVPSQYQNKQKAEIYSRIC